MSLRRQPTLRLEQTSTVRRTSKLGWAYRRRAQVFCVVALHQDTRAHADRLPLACVAAASRPPRAGTRAGTRGAASPRARRRSRHGAPPHAASPFLFHSSFFALPSVTAAPATRISDSSISPSSDIPLRSPIPPLFLGRVIGPAPACITAWAFWHCVSTVVSTHSL